MATMTLCNTVFILMLLAALSTCHGNAFGAWSGKQRQRKKKLAIYRSWPWISNCWEWDSNSGLSGIEPRALTTRPRRLGANLRRDATSRLLFLNQSVLADFDDRKKKTTGFKTRSLSGTSKKASVKVARGQVLGTSRSEREPCFPTSKNVFAKLRIHPGSPHCLRVKLWIFDHSWRGDVVYSGWMGVICHRLQCVLTCWIDTG